MLMMDNPYFLLTSFASLLPAPIFTANWNIVITFRAGTNAIRSNNHEIQASRLLFSTTSAYLSFIDKSQSSTGRGEAS